MKNQEIPMDTSNNDMLKLDNQLCFALYVTSKEIIRKYKTLLDPLNLTYTSYITLLALWEEDGVTIKSLGKRLYLDSGTLTPLLKKLEIQNLLERVRSSEDERRVMIFLTKEGHALKESVAHIPNQMICAIDVEENKASNLLNLLHEFMPKL